MASSKAPQIMAFLADAAISKGLAVKLGTDNKHVAKSSAATDSHIGICQAAVTAAEDTVEVAVQGGAKALAGGTISAGDYVTADSNGALVATTTANDNVIGQAMQSAVANDIFEVLITNFNY